jgi:AraC-like DNA-binding protein
VKLDLPRERQFEAGVWYSTPASTWYPTHYHEEFELKLVLWGRASYQMDSTRIELGPGSLLWLAPGQEHTLLGISDQLSMWVASFRLDTVREAEKSSIRVLDQAGTWGACGLPAARVLELSALLAELVHCEDPQLVNPRSGRLLAQALNAWQEHRFGASLCILPLGLQPYPLHPAVMRARSLLRALDADLSLDSLSRRCGLDGPRLSRLFKRQMGLSIVQFRNHFRVQQFIAGFGRGGERNMLQAALDSGFGSYPQFHRAFHQVTGYAPSEHLRRVRAGIVVPTYQGLEAHIED